MYQFVDANQWSPRVSLTYKPFAGTTLHAGYARYFTPPSQVLAAPTNVAAVDNTTQASQTCGGQSPVVEPPCGLVLPERSHYFDVGFEQRIFLGLKVGVDGYYKIARDLLDDGQFGAALVLDGFNYAKAYNEGIELKADYNVGNLRAYGNLAIAQQKGTNIVRQGLRDPRRLRHRRLCPAVRPAPRVLGRPIAKILSAPSPPVIPGHCPASRAHWHNFRFLRPVKISGTFRRPYRC